MKGLLFRLLILAGLAAFHVVKLKAFRLPPAELEGVVAVTTGGIGATNVSSGPAIETVTFSKGDGVWYAPEYVVFTSAISEKGTVAFRTSTSGVVIIKAKKAKKAKKK